MRLSPHSQGLQKNCSKFPREEKWDPITRRPGSPSEWRQGESQSLLRELGQGDSEGGDPCSSDHQGSDWDGACALQWSAWVFRKTSSCTETGPTQAVMCFLPTLWTRGLFPPIPCRQAQLLWWIQPTFTPGSLSRAPRVSWALFPACLSSKTGSSCPGAMRAHALLHGAFPQSVLAYRDFNVVFSLPSFLSFLSFFLPFLPFSLPFFPPFLSPILFFLSTVLPQRRPSKIHPHLSTICLSVSGLRVCLPWNHQSPNSSPSASSALSSPLETTATCNLF